MTGPSPVWYRSEWYVDNLHGGGGGRQDAPSDFDPRYWAGADCCPEPEPEPVEPLHCRGAWSPWAECNQSCTVSIRDENYTLIGTVVGEQNATYVVEEVMPTAAGQVPPSPRARRASDCLLSCRAGGERSREQLLAVAELPRRCHKPPWGRRQRHHRVAGVRDRPVPRARARAGAGARAIL